jgi:hypothetical protein
MPDFPQSEPKYDSLWQLVSRRLYWFFIGPMFLILMLIGILNGDSSQRLFFIVAFLVGLALLPVSKWLELRSGKGRTAAGEPLSNENLRNYTLASIGIGLAALGVAVGWAIYASHN